MDLSMTSQRIKDRHNTYHPQVLNEQMTFAIVLIPLMQESVPPSDVLFNSVPVQVASLTYTSDLLQHRARSGTKNTMSIKRILHHFDVKTKHNIAQRSMGRPFPRSPRSRSRVTLRVVRPLTRGPQGQPSPLRTPQSRLGVQGIFPTSRSQTPHGWPMDRHSMATAFRLAPRLLRQVLFQKWSSKAERGIYWPHTP